MVQEGMNRGSQSNTINNDAHSIQEASHYGNTYSNTLTNGGQNSYERQGLSHISHNQVNDPNSRGFPQYGDFDGMQNPTPSNSYRDRFYPRRQQVSQTYSSHLVEAKLPPFNGKEEWKVWINRFESVAKRRNWDNEAKLDNILPRLQGKAGDFVFNQLSQEVISCYPKLVKELNSRFHTIETEKTYAAKFSQRVQKHDETAEEYAAELKRLYSKAYKNRDCKTRQEDLVRRFLDGLKDHEARFEVEYHKEPEDIDQAVYHVVNFIQTRRRNYSDMYADRKAKKFARRASQVSDIEDSEIECEADVGDYEYVMRLPVKGGTDQKKKLQSKGEQKTELNLSHSTTKGNSMSELTDMVKALTEKVEKLQKGNTVASGYQRKASGVGNESGIVCYACNNRGHISRNCPEKNRAQSTSDNRKNQPANQGR
ncbi:MAG: zinc finger CCHC domain-containing protein, partial [Candidatus Thiodiazotropha sp.]